MTHRQMLAWTAWLDMEWNRPSRSDQYIMAVCAEVRRVLHKHPNRVELKHFLLKFEGKTAKKKLVTEEQKLERAQALSMAKWVGAVGGMKGLRVVEVDSETYDPHQSFDPNPFIEPYIVEADEE